MNNEEVKEIEDLCAMVFIKWHIGAQHDEKTHDMIMKNSFTAKILTKKFEAFDIGIKLPDELLLILGTCSGENPGLVQAILMDLLQSIKDKKGSPIPRGYEITPSDVVGAFPLRWPILEDPEIYNEYISKYDATIKDKATDSNGNKFNACDTKEFWLQVMEA